MNATIPSFLYKEMMTVSPTRSAELHTSFELTPAIHISLGLSCSQDGYVSAVPIVFG